MKTFWKDLSKTIFKTKVTFASILLFVMMATLLFFGMDWSSKTLTNSINYFFETTNSYDIQIKIAPGYLNPEDFLNIENVDEVEGLYSQICEFKNEQNCFEANFLSTPNKINTLYDVEGIIPSKPGEIALIRYWAEDNDFHINDLVTIKNEPVYGTEKRFVNDTFKVTAIVDSSLYTAKKTNIFGISPQKNIPVNATFFVDKSSFNPIINNMCGYDTIYLKSNSLREINHFSQEYYDKVESLQNSIKKSSILEGKTCAVSTLRDNISHQNSQITSEVFQKIKYSLSGLFLIVGLLVSYFSISRLLSECKAQIGIKKANGFAKNEIRLFYVLYVAFSVLVGSVLGVIGARFIVEPAVASALPKAVVIPKTIYEFNILVPLLFLAGQLVIQSLITLMSIRKIVNKNAIDLLKNENQILGKKRFYQKWHIWNKFSLVTKTIINNFFNEKTRVFSMFVGISGCTALLICGLTIDRNITNSFETQFNKVFSFQAVVNYDNECSTDNVKHTLDGKEFTYSDVMFTFMNVACPNGKTVTAQTYIFKEDNFNEFVHLYNTNNEPLQFEDGVYISCSYKETFGLDEHAKVEITNSALESYEVETKGFFQHYLINNFIFMNAKTYEEVFNGFYKSNALLINLNGHDYQELLTIKSDPSVIVMYDIYGTSKTSFSTITSVFKVLNGVFLVVSLMMALLVVLDLLSMLIDEKKTELITLMINGYSRNVAKKYIYLDTILISVIGILFGVLFGTLMSLFALSAFQNETMYFVSGFNWISTVIGVAIAALIILFVTLLALRKINKFKLTDLNKVV